MARSPLNGRSDEIDRGAPHRARSTEGKGFAEVAAARLQASERLWAGHRAFVAETILFAAVVLSVWGRWRAMVLIAVLQLTRAAATFWGSRLPLVGASARLSFLIVNGPLVLAVAHVAGWTIAAWLGIPLLILVADMFREDCLRMPSTLLIPPAIAVATLDGVALSVIVGFTGFSVLVSFLGRSRGLLVERMHATLLSEHAELERAHEALAKMHASMVAQEKLSSLGMMAAGVAHEINNPMSYVKSAVTMVVEELQQLKPLPPALEECVGDLLPSALDGIERVNTIVADLRRFSRRDGVTLSPYDLNAEVGAAVRLARPQFAKGRRVNLELEPVPTALGRPQQITQVILNLIVNAAQAIEDSGAVRVSTHTEDDDVVLIVADDGIGMAPHIMTNLFEPFFTTKPEGVGTGLGLAVSHRIVTEHGGNIDVESTIGRGTVFTVRLPRDPASAIQKRGQERMRAAAPDPVRSWPPQTGEDGRLHGHAAGA